MSYSFEIRGSVRTSGKDDFWCGSDGASTFAEAQAELSAWRNGPVGKRTIGPGDHIYIIGPDEAVMHHEVLPGARHADDDAEGSEFAMQQGMAFGVDAYNDAMGY